MFNATYTMPNPMYPNVRHMGFEVTRKVKTKEEARELARKNGWDLECIKPN